MKTIAAFLLVLGVLFAAPVHAQNAKLKAGDPVMVELKVPAEDAPNVTGKYNISDGGTVKIPYLDREISAAGLSTTELARRIEMAYKGAEIFTNPTVNVTTPTPVDYAPHIVTVGGEVKSGGREVPVRDGMRLYNAIMAAGGFTEFADVKRVKIIRGTREMIYDMRRLDAAGKNNPVLLDGDTVHVPQD